MLLLQVHSLANGPEVTKPLLETSRKGYLAALSASSYSFVSMMQRFGPIMNEGGAAVSLTYIASEQVIPGYGGGMSSAKAVSWQLLLYLDVGCELGPAAPSRMWAGGDMGGPTNQQRPPRWMWAGVDRQCVTA